MKFTAILLVAAAVFVSAAAYTADVDAAAHVSVHTVRHHGANLPQLKRRLAAAENRLRTAEDKRDDAKDRLNELEERKEREQRGRGVSHALKKLLRVAAKRLRAAEDARDDAKDVRNAIKKRLDAVLRREGKRAD